MNTKPGNTCGQCEHAFSPFVTKSKDRNLECLKGGDLAELFKTKLPPCLCSSWCFVSGDSDAAQCPMFKAKDKQSQRGKS